MSLIIYLLFFCVYLGRGTGRKILEASFGHCHCRIQKMAYLLQKPNHGAYIKWSQWSSNWIVLLSFRNPKKLTDLCTRFLDPLIFSTFFWDYAGFFYDFKNPFISLKIFQSLWHQIAFLDSCRLDWFFEGFLIICLCFFVVLLSFFSDCLEWLKLCECRLWVESWII